MGTCGSRIQPIRSWYVFFFVSSRLRQSLGLYCRLSGHEANALNKEHGAAIDAADIADPQRAWKYSSQCQAADSYYSRTEIAHFKFYLEN